MSSKRSSLAKARQLRRHAPVFAALGDKTRLSLLHQLGRARPHSIAELTRGRPATRQAISKHLRILEDVNLVRATTVGRERRFELKPQTIDHSVDYLRRVSARWDKALERLRDLIEKK